MRVRARARVRVCVRARARVRVRVCACACACACACGVGPRTRAAWPSGHYGAPHGCSTTRIVRYALCLPLCVMPVEHSAELPPVPVCHANRVCRVSCCGVCVWGAEVAHQVPRAVPTAVAATAALQCRSSGLARGREGGWVDAKACPQANGA